MFQRDFTPQFQLELMEKDVRYFLQLAADLDRPAPLASRVRSQYQAARRAAPGKLDSSAIQVDAGKHQEARRISDACRDRPQLGSAVQGGANQILADVAIAHGVALFLDQGRVAEARRLAEEALAQLDDAAMEAGQHALRSALEQRQLRAGKIEDAAMREGYLALPHHRRVLELAREYGVLPT